MPAQLLCSQTKMDFQHLTDVHTGRNAQRIQNDIQRCAIGQERHILLAQNAGNNALVTMTTGHLIAHGNLTLLGDVHTHHHVHAGRQLVLVFTGEGLNIHDDAALAVRDFQGCVAHLARLFAEDGAEQALFCGQLGLALGRDFAHQNVTGADFCTDADDAVLVQILDGIIADIGNIASNFLRP